jgi:hypothetical protein
MRIEYGVAMGLPPLGDHLVADGCEAAAGLLGEFGLVPEALGEGEPMEAAGEATEERVVPTASPGTS